MSNVAVPVVPPPAEPVPQLVASRWHTAAFLLLIAAVATLSALGHKQGAAAPVMTTYISTLAWEWAMFGIVIFGIRRKGLRFRDLMGQRWSGFDDGLMDLVYGVGLLLSSFVVRGLVLVAGKYLFHLSMGQAEAAQRLKDLAFITPHNALEALTFIAMCFTAGFVEEVVFRGYMQRQMIALTGSATFGIIVAAVLFGLGHAYQGAFQVFNIVIMGAMLGVLAHWRKNLKPGIIAHTMQDLLSGVILYLASRGLLPM
jgi:uncharacterized protein